MTRQTILGVVLAVGLLACTHTQPKAKHTLNLPIVESSVLDHLKVISSDLSQGRKVGSPGSELVQNYIIKTLQSYDVLPFKNDYKHQFYLSESLISKATFGTNIVAFIPSKTKNSGYIVLTAHYDHLGIKGGRVYNGADDNASGTSALLALTNKIASDPLNHNVVIVFTDSEESNLKGIRAFLNQNLDLVKKAKLNINLDMLAGSKNNKRLYYVSRNLNLLLSDIELAQFDNNHLFTNFTVKKGFKRGRHSLNKNVDWIRASDHYEFHKRKIPFIYYGVGTHKNYHTTNDTYENTNHRLLHHSTNAIFHQLLYLDQAI